MSTYRDLSEKLSCAIDHVVTDNDLKELRTHLNAVLGHFHINVKFTSHFLDRVNDARNNKQITVCELARLFIEAFRQHKDDFLHVTKKSWEAVMSDSKTAVNVPFVLQHNGREIELVAKTVMRKANFHPNAAGERKLTVAHFEPKGTHMKESTKTFRDLREWVGFNTPEVAPIGAPFSVDNVDNGAMNVEDPTNLDMLNGYCHQINNQQYINPYYPLNTLWRKLSLIGLNFDLRSIGFGGVEGTREVALNQYGGRYGFVTPDNTIGSDDGISHRLPGGLKLVIRFQKNGGVYSLDAQIVSGSDDASFVEEQFTGIDQVISESEVKPFHDVLVKAGYKLSKQSGNQHLYTHPSKPKAGILSGKVIGTSALVNGNKFDTPASLKSHLTTVSEAWMAKPKEGATWHMTNTERTAHGLKHSHDKIVYWQNIIANHKTKGTDPTRAIKMLKRAQESLKIFQMHHDSDLKKK